MDSRPTAKAVRELKLGAIDVLGNFRRSPMAEASSSDLQRPSV